MISAWLSHNIIKPFCFLVPGQRAPHIYCYPTWMCGYNPYNHGFLYALSPLHNIMLNKVFMTTYKVSRFPATVSRNSTYYKSHKKYKMNQYTYSSQKMLDARWSTFELLSESLKAFWISWAFPWCSWWQALNHSALLSPLFALCLVQDTPCSANSGFASQDWWEGFFLQGLCAN